ncbi:MAG: hypothetical protein Tsb006_6290 [Rickettsiaceae bacterium]|tara:strand:- start:546 stop:1382 length:837 start_codon:yes stop_codon:yes gene_type:complete
MLSGFGFMKKLSIQICLAYVVLQCTFSSLCALSVLVQYPISEASGERALGGVMDERLTASPLRASKQLRLAESRGLLEKISGDYLFSGWSTNTKRHFGNYIEFGVTAHSGFKVSYDSIEFTLYSTEGSGPRFWELRARTTESGEWDEGRRMFGNSSTEDTSILLQKIDMHNFPQSTVNVKVTDLGDLINPAIRTGKTTLFRLYGYGAQGGQGGFYNVWSRGKDLSLSGVIGELKTCDNFENIEEAYRPVLSPIPEPKNASLIMVLGLFGALFLRRKKL